MAVPMSFVVLLFAADAFTTVCDGLWHSVLYVVERARWDLVGHAQSIHDCVTQVRFNFLAVSTWESQLSRSILFFCCCGTLM